MTFQALCARLLRLVPVNRQRVVAIHGTGGAGKSTFAARLALELVAEDETCEAVVVHLDDLYRPAAPGEAVPSCDWDRYERQVLAPLKAGRQVVYERYDWCRDTVAETVSVATDAFMIIEGHSEIRAAFRHIYDYVIWVDAAEPVRKARLRERDGVDRMHFWERIWLPEERARLLRDRPFLQADLTIDGARSDYSTRSFVVQDPNGEVSADGCPSPQRGAIRR